MLVYQLPEGKPNFHSPQFRKHSSLVPFFSWIGAQGQTCTGKVKSFRGEWGFITSDSLEGNWADWTTSGSSGWIAFQIEYFVIC